MKNSALLHLNKVRAIYDVMELGRSDSTNIFFAKMIDVSRKATIRSSHMLITHRGQVIRELMSTTGTQV